MSDEWKFFMCNMGENLASIMVDVGISDDIARAPPNLATVTLTYKQPDERGMPTNAEFDAVVALEDRLDTFVKLDEDAYVGRITKEGQRIFFVYTHRAEAPWAHFVEQLASSTGYKLELQLEKDPEHTEYWKYLYPTPDDWQVIADMKVVEQLEKAGDDREAEHVIEHFAYFPDESSATRFVAWATSDRFTHVEKESGWTEDKNFGVRVNHVGNTIQSHVSSHTIALRRKAEEFGGEYDGWGTAAVVRE